MLYLSDNNLNAVPPEMGNLNRLILLYLRDNYLASLPVEFGNLTNLSELWLDGNELDSISPELCAALAGRVYPPSLCGHQE
jgi:Leucine-rich repeat (LRR) protein